MFYNNHVQLVSCADGFLFELYAPSNWIMRNNTYFRNTNNPYLPLINYLPEYTTFEQFVNATGTEKLTKFSINVQNLDNNSQKIFTNIN